MDDLASKIVELFTILNEKSPEEVSKALLDAVKSVDNKKPVELKLKPNKASTLFSNKNTEITIVCVGAPSVDLENTELHLIGKLKDSCLISYNVSYNNDSGVLKVVAHVATDSDVDVVRTDEVAVLRSSLWVKYMIHTTSFWLL